MNPHIPEVKSPHVYLKSSMLHHKCQDFTKKDSIFCTCMQKLSRYILLLLQSSKADRVNMERKREYSSACTISSYLFALVFILAFTLPTLLSASNFFSTKNNIFPEFIKWHISVVNGMSNNQNLLTHCKSAEDDLSINNLSPNSNLTWSFRTDFFQSTMFWCRVKNESASTSFQVFWHDDRLFNKCEWKNCIWVVKDDGVYLKNLSESVDELYFGWDAGL